MRPSSLLPVVGYARVSTLEQGDSGLGLAAQEAAIRAACRARRLQLLRIHQDIASGGSLEGRPELARALATVRSGGAAALVVAKLDRLSRSVHDFSGLLEQAPPALHRDRDRPARSFSRTRRDHPEAPTRS